MQLLCYSVHCSTVNCLLLLLGLTVPVVLITNWVSLGRLSTIELAFLKLPHGLYGVNLSLQMELEMSEEGRQIPDIN